MKCKTRTIQTTTNKQATSTTTTQQSVILLPVIKLLLLILNLLFNTGTWRNTVATVVHVGVTRAWTRILLAVAATVFPFWSSGCAGLCGNGNTRNRTEISGNRSNGGIAITFAGASACYTASTCSSCVWHGTSIHRHRRQRYVMMMDKLSLLEIETAYIQRRAQCSSQLKFTFDAFTIGTVS